MSTPGNRRAPLVITLPAPTRGALAEHAVALHARAVADLRAGGDHAVAQRAARADPAPSNTTARSTVEPAPTRTPAPSTAPSPTRAPSSEAASRGEQRRARPRTPVRDRAAEDVERALQVALRRPDVEPVALADGAVEARRRPAAGRRRARSTRAAGLEQAEHRALEHVGAGRDVARVDLVGRRLLDELGHLAVGAVRTRP